MDANSQALRDLVFGAVLTPCGQYGSKSLGHSLLFEIEKISIF